MYQNTVAHLPKEHPGGAVHHMVVDASLLLEEVQHVLASLPALLSVWLTYLPRPLCGACQEETMRAGTGMRKSIVEGKERW